MHVHYIGATPTWFIFFRHPHGTPLGCAHLTLETVLWGVGEFV
jgi:hypothetical protein